MDDIPGVHFRLLAKFFRQGTVVPFLGAGVNLCDRAIDDVFVPGRLLPSGAELAQHLADEFYYPNKGVMELSRVSQYVAVTAGFDELYRNLHGVFDADYPPTLLHHFLARLPSHQIGEAEVPHLLIITTNYDDALERAFDEAGEPYDLVNYITEGRNRGKCRHIAPDGTSCIIDRPNEYHEVSLEHRSVIVKIHGAVSRGEAHDDSFVITEDNYIDYLTRTEITELFPIHVASKLSSRSTHFLFLGYSLRDWNLRVILRRIWGQQELRNKSWAVQKEADDLDRACWGQRGEVEILETPLRDYILRLIDVLAEPVGPKVTA